MDERASRRRLIAGCMSGTSMDALDVALVEARGAGLQISIRLERVCTRPLGEIGRRLERLALGHPHTAEEITRLGYDFALLHLEVLQHLLGDDVPDLVAVHGQTVYHQPPLSWQLFNPAPVAAGLGVPVVCDLRSADLALGGQGAPITPLADWVMFRHPTERRIVANLGGFANCTFLPPAPDGEDANLWIQSVQGRDVCVCNLLLNRLSQQCLGQPYDRDGSTAMEGKVNEGLFEELRIMLGRQAVQNRSLGTGDEHFDWVESHRMRISAGDLLRTTCAAIGEVVTANMDADLVILAGGGTRNRALVKEIRSRSPIPVVLSDELGIPSAYREAMAMAVLGALAMDGVSTTLVQVTGASRAVVGGVWTKL